MRSDIIENNNSAIKEPRLHFLYIYSLLAPLQTKFQHQTLLKVTLVTKQIKCETSHMCAASKLTQQIKHDALAK